MKTKTNKIQDLFIKHEILNLDLSVNEAIAKPLLIKVKRGLKQYLNIQRSVHLTPVNKDVLFQEIFSNFYKIDPFRDKEWKDKYFNLFEMCKNKNPDFEGTLRIFYKNTGEIEASFISKLVATINPDLPVIDKIVLNNLSLYSNYQKINRSEDKSLRILSVVDLYNELNTELIVFLKTKGGKNLYNRFIDEYPYSHITKIKILDLILWQLR